MFICRDFSHFLLLIQLIAAEWGVENLPRALLEALQQLVTMVHLTQSVVHEAINNAVDASC